MKPVLFLFGSQTGAARSIAESLHATATSKGIPSVLAPLNDHDKIDFLSSPVAVVVCSTTGNGDAPSNAEDFWRFVRKRTHPKDMLAGLHFALLGLGDTNYDKFCGSAKSIVKRFSELGAATFYPPAFADESVGLETVVDPWAKDLWPALERLVSQLGRPAQSTAPVVTHDAQPPQNGGSGAGEAPSAPTAVPTSVQPCAAEEGASATLSPMSQMKAVMALQVQQRRRSVPGASESVPGASESVPVASESVPGASEADGGLAPATGVAAGAGGEGGESSDGVLHLHTHGVRETWGSGSQQPSGSDASALGVGTRSRSATGDGRSAVSDADVRVDTRGKTPDDILEAVANAAASAVYADMARARSASTAAAALSHSSAPPLPPPTSSAEGLSIRAPTVVPPALSFPDLDQIQALGIPQAITPTPGVRGLWELFPSLVHHAEAARTPRACRPEDVIPPSSSSVSAKLFPPTPPVTVSARLLTAREAHALRTTGGSSAESGASSTAQLAPAPTAGGLPARSAAGGGAGAVATSSPPSRDTPGKSLDAPVTVPITGARYLTSGGRGSDRRVVHLELGVGGTPLGAQGAWGPGDAIGILAPNDAAEVLAICRRLGYHPQARIEVTSLSAGGGLSSVRPGASGADSPRPDVHVTKATSTTGVDGIAVRTPGGASGEPGSAGVVGASLPIYFPSWLPGYPQPTLADVLTWCVDIRGTPKKSFYRMLSESCGGGGVGATASPTVGIDADALMWLAGRGGKEGFKALVEDQHLSLPDVLALFPSAQPSLSALLSCLPALAPRFYSLTCSPLATPHTLSVAFTVVQYEVQAGVGGVATPPPSDTPHPATARDGGCAPITRSGLATTWLERLAEPWLRSCEDGPAGHAPPSLRIFLRPSKDFLPPASLSTPLVMIGPGTGVAPFLGFLAHRAAKVVAHDKAGTLALTGMWRGVPITTLREDKEVWSPVNLGSCLLLFGNRSPDVDFLYKEELSGHVGSGALTCLVTAWSRHTPGKKVYVQHKLAEEETSRSVAELLLLRGGHVYVCGDGAHMAKDVHGALIDCLNTWVHLVGGWGAGRAGGGAPSTPIGTPSASPARPPASSSLAGGAAVCAPPGGGPVGGVDAASAADFLADLAKRGRYVRDIWS